MQRITDWRVGIIYDVEQLPIAIAAGQEFNFYRNLAIAGVPKTRLQTNIVTPSQLPSGHRAIVYGVHLMCGLNIVHDDVQTIMNSAYFEFVTGDQKTELQGPAWFFPSPFGLTGYVSQDGLAAPRELSSINNGIPSPSAIGKLEIPIDLVGELTFQGTLRFYNAQVLNNITNFYVVMRAYIQSPVR